MSNCKCDEPTSTTPTSSSTTCSTPSTYNPCMSLLTPQQEQQLRGAVRPTTINPIIGVVGGLASGASSAAITIPAKSLFWTFCIDDFVATLGSPTTMDGLELFVHVGGIAQIDLFGGRFARGTSNPCTGCADRCICVGPVDTVTITVKNISGAALAATDTAALQYRPIYSGEKGFICGACGPTPTTSYSVQEIP